MPGWDRARVMRKVRGVMGVGYHAQPDLARYIRGLESRLAMLERRQDDTGKLSRATSYVRQSGTLTLPSGVEKLVTPFVVAEGWDVGGLYSSDTPDRLTVPIQGMYVVCANGVFSTTANITLRFGGTALGAGADSNTSEITRLLRFDEPGEYVQLYATQSSGTSQTLAGASLAVAHVGEIA